MASIKSDDGPEILKQVKLDDDQLMEKVKVEYLPYFVGKFTNLKRSEVKEVSFVEDDVQFVNTVQLFCKIQIEDKHRDNFCMILADFNGIFYAFRKLLEILFQRYLTEEDFNEPCVSCTMIITLMMNVSDTNRDFARKLCKEPGLLEVFVLFLRQVKDKHFAKTDIRRFGDEVLTRSINTFYNCSMYVETRQRLREVGCLGACLPYLDSHHHYTRLVSFLCVAYLADEKQSGIFQAKKDLIRTLVDVLKSAIRDPTRKCTADDITWSANEVANGLNALARNDTNKKLIIECGTIDVLLMGAFLQDAPDVQADTMLVLWTLSFDDDAKTTLKQNQKAMKLFDTIVSTVPKHRCRKAAKGILWNLRDAEMHQPTEEQSKHPHIMISYQWDVQPLVLKVRDALRAAGYKVWVDVDDLEGSTTDAMAKAVENSAVVLMCVSHMYKESQNCQAEARYANKLRKKIIPLVVETGYKADGWLGLIQGDEKYYDITNKRTFEDKTKELVKALGPTGKSSDSSQKASMLMKVTETRKVRPLDVPDGRSLKNWDKSQVSELMKQYGIRGKKVCGMDGKQLHFLKRMFQRAPEYYYSFVERNLCILMDDFSDFTALTNALEELPDD